MAVYKDDVAQSFKFWRFLRIAEDTFLNSAETGDLLLCSNKKMMGKMTMEHYVDRIFMVIKLTIDGY
jgi:hypothetical protein